MQAERVILETDANGRVSELPLLPPSSTIEAIFVVLDSKAPDKTASDVPFKSAPKTGKDLVQLFSEISALCTLPPDDHFSGEDHDKVLYGWEKKS